MERRKVTIKLFKGKEAALHLSQEITNCVSDHQ